MTDLEHLIENAICLAERGKTFDIFRSYLYNKEMSRRTKVRLEDAWNIAVYVVNTCKPYWQAEALEECKETGQ